MNTFQALRQLAYLARAAQWAASQPLFRPDSVIITSGIPEMDANSLAYPSCFIGPGDEQGDPEAQQEPGLIKASVSVKAMVMIPGDQRGTSSLLGANRSPTTAAGHGLLEVRTPLLAALRLLNDANGVRIQSVHSATGKPEVLPDKMYVAWEEHRFELWLTDAKHFPSCVNYVATGGAGSVAHSWALPGTRFDLRRAILRRAAGSTPPASATSGTGISLGGSPDGSGVSSVTDNLKWIVLASIPSPDLTTVGEVFTQAVTGATFVLVSYDVNNLKMYVSSVTGSPDNSHAWTGGTNGSVFTPTTVPAFQPGTYSYSLFAAYDDYTVVTGQDAPTSSGASDKDVSAAISRASVVVT